MTPCQPSHRGHWIAIAVALAACRSSDSDSKTIQPLPTPSPIVTGDSRPKPYASALSFHSTTPADSAIRTLNSRIEQLERVSDRNSKQTAWHAELVALLLERAHLLGATADYASAIARAEELVERAPRRAQSYLVRARARAGVHRFELADADLQHAEKLGATARELERERAAFSFATGQLDEALKLRTAAVEQSRNYRTLSALALVATELGQFERAETLYREAVEKLRKPSPFPFSALCFQWARMYERWGNPGAARELYELIRSRLPQHAEATAHFAALRANAGDSDRAAALLEELVRHSDNPEYLGQLAAVEAARGNRARADDLANRARRGYEALLAELPEAFADHAARFYLGAGNDPRRAHDLAQHNLQLRSTSASYQLAIEAALSAGDKTRACVDATAAITAKYVPKALQFSAWRAFSACEDEDNVKRLARTLGIDE